MSLVYETIIIGGGPAGLSAALFAGRYNLRTLLLASELGGALMEAFVLDNYPGFIDNNSVKFFQNLEKQVAQFSEKVIIHKNESVQNIVPDKSGRLFVLESERGEYGCESIILAQGSKRIRLNVPGERDLIGKGVSYCATYDAFLFKGKAVAVVGNGDGAASAALTVAEFAKKVYLISPKIDLLTKPVWEIKVKAKNNIEILNNYNVIGISGKEQVENVELNTDYQGKKKLAVAGVIIELGREPETGLASQIGCSLDEQNGRIKVNGACVTSHPAVLAAGDSTTSSLGIDQVITACSEGAIAATSAYRYLRQFDSGILKH